MNSKHWQDLILQQFGHEQTQSVVVVDPDRLMQDDVLISELQARRYDILNFTTEIAFRNEFEERYRSRWDRGEKTHIVVIVHSSEALRQLPYHLEKKGHLIEIGLHQVFPHLSRIVPADVARRYYPALTTLCSLAGWATPATLALTPGIPKPFVAVQQPFGFLTARRGMDHPMAVKIMDHPAGGPVCIGKSPRTTGAQYPMQALT